MHTATQTLRLYRVLRESTDVAAAPGCFFCSSFATEFVPASELDDADIAALPEGDREEAMAEIDALDAQDTQEAA